MILYLVEINGEGIFQLGAKSADEAEAMIKENYANRGEVRLLRMNYQHVSTTVKTINTGNINDG